MDSLVIRKAVIFAPLDNDRFRAAGALNIYKGRKPLYTDGRLIRPRPKRYFPASASLGATPGTIFRPKSTTFNCSGVARCWRRSRPFPVRFILSLSMAASRATQGRPPGRPLEPTLRAHLHSRYQFIFGLANDELGYIIPKAEWDNQPPWLQNKKDRWYGEVNSAGEEVAGTVMRALVA